MSELYSGFTKDDRDPRYLSEHAAQAFRLARADHERRQVWMHDALTLAVFALDAIASIDLCDGDPFYKCHIEKAIDTARRTLDTIRGTDPSTDPDQEMRYLEMFPATKADIARLRKEIHTMLNQGFLDIQSSLLTINTAIAAEGTAISSLADRLTANPTEADLENIAAQLKAAANNIQGHTANIGTLAVPAPPPPDPTPTPDPVPVPAG